MESPDHQTAGFSTPIGTRRRFFQLATGAAASVIAVGLSIPLIGFLISPAFQPLRACASGSGAVRR